MIVIKTWVLLKISLLISADLNEKAYVANWWSKVCYTLTVHNIFLLNIFYLFYMLLYMIFFRLFSSNRFLLSLAFTSVKIGILWNLWILIGSRLFSCCYLDILLIDNIRMIIRRIHHRSWDWMINRDLFILFDCLSFLIIQWLLKISVKILFLLWCSAF